MNVFFVIFFFCTHIIFLGIIKVAYALSDEKRAKIIKIRKSKIFCDWIIKSLRVFFLYYMFFNIQRSLTLYKKFQVERIFLYFLWFGAKYQEKRGYFPLWFLGAKFIVLPPSMVNRKTFTYTTQVFMNNFVMVSIVSIPKLNNIRQLS